MQDAGQLSDNMQRMGGGIGLDDIHDDYSNPMSARLPKSMDPKMRVASNRAFIQYFAKLGQSMVDDEIINLEFVHTLVNSGADINCADKYGQTVLHEVIVCLLSCSSDRILVFSHLNLTFRSLVKII